MKLSGLIPLLLVWFFAFTRALEQWPLHNNGINSVVEWYAFISESNNPQI